MATTQRTFQARKAAYIMHATCDAEQRAAKISAARWARLEAAVDPDGTMRPAERRRRAEALMHAQMVELARRSAATRAVKKAGQPSGAKLSRQCCECARQAHGGDVRNVPGGRTDGLCQRHADEFRRVYHEAVRLGIVSVNATATSDHGDPLPAA